jgi:DNA-binding NarL/FixJ family response regulator
VTNVIKLPIGKSSDTNNCVIPTSPGGDPQHGERSQQQSPGDPNIPTRVPTTELTKSEIMVLDLMFESGLSLEAMAKDACLSRATLATHMNTIYRKLGITKTKSNRPIVLLAAMYYGGRINVSHNA